MFMKNFKVRDTQAKVQRNKRMFITKTSGMARRRTYASPCRQRLVSPLSKNCYLKLKLKEQTPKRVKRPKSAMLSKRKVGKQVLDPLTVFA